MFEDATFGGELPSSGYSCGVPYRARIPPPRRNSSNLKSPQTEIFLLSAKYLLSEALSILPVATSWLLRDRSSSQASVRQPVHTNIYLRVGAQHEAKCVT